MKIAVILTGHPRSFSLVCRRLKQRLEAGVTVDFFCHVWSDSNGTHLSWNNRDVVKPSRSKVGEIVALVNPKFLIYKVQAPTPTLADGNVLVVSNLRSMFDGICEGISSVLNYSEETGKQYDLVVRGRYDLVLGRELITNELRKSINERRMFLAGSDTYHQLGGISDVFFFAPPVVMKELFGINQYIEDAFQGQKEVGPSIIPEILFRNYLAHKNIKIAHTDLPCSIMRSSGKLLSINLELLSGQGWNSILLFNPVEPRCCKSKIIFDRILQGSKIYLAENGVADPNLIVDIISSSNTLRDGSPRSFEDFKMVLNCADVFFRTKDVLGRERTLSWLLRGIWLNSFYQYKAKSVAFLIADRFLIVLFMDYIFHISFQRAIRFWRKTFGL